MRAIKTVFIVRTADDVVLIGTNLKACYECVLHIVNEKYHSYIQSYAQVTRIVRKDSKVSFTIPYLGKIDIKEIQVVKKFEK